MGLYTVDIDITGLEPEKDQKVKKSQMKLLHKK